MSSLLARSPLLAGLTAAIAVTLAMSSQTVAAADNGDNRPQCNAYEICLALDNPGGVWQRHYSYGGDDNGTWINATTGVVSGTLVHDKGSSLRNRDSTCVVYWVDYYSGSRTVRNQRLFGNGSSSFVGVNASFNDSNDAHWRCRVGGP